MSETIQTDRGRIRRWFWRPDAPEGGRLSRSFAEACDGGAELNEDVVRMFLWQGFVGGEETLARGIYCLPGDADFELDGGELKLLGRRYYEFGEAPSEAPLEEVVTAGKDAFSRAVAAELDRGGSGHCVPLSSGLDSRMMLGELLEHLPASELRTCSWAGEGTWDFEHAREVAKAAGVPHVMFDYADHDWSADSLRRVALETDGNAPILLHNPIERIEARMGPTTLWSGALGDATAGNWLPPEELTDPVEWFLSLDDGASRRFAERMAPDLGWRLPLDHGEPGLSPEWEAEAVQFYNRQERLIANLNCFRSVDVRAPFVRPEWTGFAFRAPRHMRDGRLIQREMLTRFYPRLARIPSSALNGKAPLGDAASRLRPIPRPWHYVRMAANVLGFPAPTNPAFVVNMRSYMRDRPDLRQTVGDLIEAAAERPFLDGRRVRRLWREFLARREVRWRKVDRVVSLEAILQAYGL